jgi:ATP-dependent Lon protease
MSESDKLTEATGPTGKNMYPVLPLRDVVVYPHMVIPLFVGRGKSIKALESVVGEDKFVFLSAQKKPSVDDPTSEDIYTVGTLASILQLLKLPDGTVKVLVEGKQRGRIVDILQKEPFFAASIELIDDVSTPSAELDTRVLARSVLTEFEQYVELHKKIPVEVIASLKEIDEPSRLADTIVAHMALEVEKKQRVLEEMTIETRLELVLAFLISEIDLLQVEQRIQKRVKQQMEDSQRAYYLSEKKKAIDKEMGELGEHGSDNEFEQLKKKIEEAGMTDEAKEKALAELNKLKMMPAMSAEATVSRNYLDWLLEIPWKKRTKVSRDLSKAEQVLEGDHYGLEKVKERIIEFLAVQQRIAKVKGPILCLVGPPGVGKTSLGQSIAKATGREFVRIALGGVRDEAEIRGHRRTYIGSMPGKIIQKMAKVKVRNPLFMLDEVDKMAMDFRGDPAAALLEVLDPEQNHAFNDHYIEVDYDLSDVLFIATANSLDIPPALLDRMEIIRIAGYTEDEKLNIALRYLVPRQIKQNGLKTKEINITQGAIREIIRYYTREAGVRNLEREISKICRKVVRSILLKPRQKRVSINHNNIERYLGVKRFRYGLAEENNQIGQVNGLAWTEVGGELLKIETMVMPGKGKSIYTGRLGDVMQESIQAAMTVVRSRSRILGIPDDFLLSHDIHVHLPEGATPKDGPSAGIGMCTALVSVLTQIPVRADVAMTGEITLRGEVLPIGGLKEKLLAALRGGIKHVIIPEENAKDLKDVPKNIMHDMKIHPVRWIDQVLELALESMPQPLVNAPAEDVVGHPVVAAVKKPKKSREERRSH